MWLAGSESEGESGSRPMLTILSCPNRVVFRALSELIRVAILDGLTRTRMETAP